MPQEMSVKEAAALIRKTANESYTPRILGWHSLHRLADLLEGKSGPADPGKFKTKDPNEKL
jgi:hypothetical protein